jgi:4-coumarate--CoA ligase
VWRSLAWPYFFYYATRNSNPAYTIDELIHQLRLTRATTIIVHTQFLKNAMEACKQVGLPTERVVIIDQTTFDAPHTTVEQLIRDGLSHRANFVERRLGAGEAKTKIAFLCLSSGTTGPPKVVPQILLELRELRRYDT